MRQTPARSSGTCGRAHQNALGAYKALTAKREKIGSLSGAEESQLLQAEKALAQKLAFDMEAVKGKAGLQPVTPQAKSTRPTPSRGVQQGFNLGDDGPGGQMMLLSSPDQPETDAQAAARQVLNRMPTPFMGGMLPETRLEVHRVRRSAL